MYHRGAPRHFGASRKAGIEKILYGPPTPAVPKIFGLLRPALVFLVEADFKAEFFFGFFINR